MSAGGKVLLALNDASEARVIGDRLAGAGIDVLTAEDGITAIAQVSEDKPDVVLCSGALPKLGGMEMCRLIKRNHKLKHVAVLLLLDDDESVAATLEVGANDYLVRPLKMNELLAAIRSHLQSRTSIARLKDDNKELGTVLEIAEVLTSTLSSTDLFHILVEKVAAALAVDQCMLLRLDATGQRATVEATTNPEDAERGSLHVSEMPEVRRCLAANKMVYVEDVRRDPELARAHGADVPRAVLAVALHVRQPGAGRAVFRMARQGEPFTYREIKFCQIVTTVAGNALENAHLYESLEIAHSTLTEVARRDALTELYNRRYLFERLELEFGRSQRKRTPLACILLDIDHFKAINDDLGHQVGDAVLTTIGRLLKECLRGHDLAGRYGGEEFLLVLPETDADGALIVAERIRREVAAAAYDGVRNRPVTVSLGIAVRQPGERLGRGLEGLIHAADQALYQAKGAGRNRVVVFEPEPEPETEPEVTPETEPETEPTAALAKG